MAIIKRNSGLSPAAHFAEAKNHYKFLLLQNTKSDGESEGAAEGGVGGIPPRPSFRI